MTQPSPLASARTAPADVELGCVSRRRSGFDYRSDAWLGHRDHQRPKNRVANQQSLLLKSSEPSLLDQAAELANQGRFDDAIAACEQHIRLKSFSPRPII